MKIPDTAMSQGIGTSPNTDAINPNSHDFYTNSIGLYAKCLVCTDYGVSCNGPKLAALGDITEVRNFHRAIKNARKITLKDIASAAPSISEYTVNDYFSHSIKDFKWTTVGVIDNALTAICGNRVGKPLLDHPCPATSSEIRQQREETEAKLQEANAECQRLRQELESSDLKRREQRTAIKEEEQRKIDHLKSQLDYLEKRCEYLKDTAEKRYNLIVARDYIIIGLVILCVILLVLSTMYLAWDFTHDGAGIFW